MNIATIAIAALCAASAVNAKAEHLNYALTTSDGRSVYKCGEKVTYKVKVTRRKDKAIPQKGGKVKVKLDNYGSVLMSEAEWDLSVTNEFSISGSLNEPGFLRLQVKGPGAPHQVTSVAFDPLKIVKGSPRPADFDEYWQKAAEKLEKEVPADVQMVKLDKYSTKDYDFHEISFATFGRRVYGYISIPTDKSKAPYPVDFSVNAAGFGGWTNSMKGHKSRICVLFSVYPFPMSPEWAKLGLKKKYDELNAETKKKYGVDYYPLGGITKGRESYFYYPVILGINRAVNWVAARPDVNRKKFRYQGTSQGGGFGLYLCGLNSAFTRAVFYVPALADTMGYLKGRQSGWPRIVEKNSKTDAQKAAAEKWAPYFDGANFASRIKCPVRVVVGFSDMTCAPCAVYAAYNEIPEGADKDIRHGIGMGHFVWGQFYLQMGKWLTEN